MRQYVAGRGHVSKEQVVVRHEDLGLLLIGSGLLVEAVLIKSAVLAEAEVRLAAGLAPESRGRLDIEVAPETGAGHRGPFEQPVQCPDLGLLIEVTHTKMVEPP